MGVTVGQPLSFATPSMTGSQLSIRVHLSASLGVTAWQCFPGRKTFLPTRTPCSHPGSQAQGHQAGVAAQARGTGGCRNQVQDWAQLSRGLMYCPKDIHALQRVTGGWQVPAIPLPHTAAFTA